MGRAGWVRSVGVCLLLAWLASLGATGSRASAAARQADEWAARRRQMVETQLRARDISDARVLAAMERVPRHLFVPERIRHLAYEDNPLPIGEGQTISQPYIVAYMTQALAVKPTARVLEVGTGSGYQAAVLAELTETVYSIEIVGQLAARARDTLANLGYKNVHVRHGDGYAGWPEHAPFDGIIVTAAPDHVPQPLIDQLALGGRMVIPIGKALQEMTIITKTTRGIRRETTIPVLFVPMTGDRIKR